MSLPISADRDPLPDAAQRAFAALLIDHTGRTVPLAERMATKDVPGLSVAVLDDGEIAWAAGAGVKEAGLPDPVTPHTLFQAASISKPIAALAVMRLVQDGRLDLDADVNTYLTSWKLPANDGWQPRVTLRRLLSHTAGTTVHGFPGYRRDRPLPSVTEILNGEAPANTDPVRVTALPGTITRYSGGGTTVVQQLLQDVTGNAFAELMHDLVLAPLGMTDSTYAQPLPESRWPDAASGHRIDGSPVHGGWHVYPEQAAAGLWTTPANLLRAVQEVQNALAGRTTHFLARSSAAEMLVPQLEGGFGVGFFVYGEGSQTRFGHGGDNDGFKASLDAFAHHPHAAVIMANADMGSDVIYELLGAIARAHNWPLALGETSGTFRQPHIPTHPIQEALAPFAGTYELRPDYLLHITLGPTGLVLTAPNQSPLPLSSASDPPKTFLVPTLDAQITISDDTLILTQGGTDLTAPRLQGANHP